MGEMKQFVKNQEPLSAGPVAHSDGDGVSRLEMGQKCGGQPRARCTQHNHGKKSSRMAEDDSDSTRL